MGNELIFEITKDGTWRSYKKPYGMIECRTEDDFKYLKEVMDKQKPCKVIEGPVRGSEWYCKCGTYLSPTKCYEIKYCIDCGQKLDWK